MNEVEVQFEPSLRLLVDYLKLNGSTRESNAFLASELKCSNRSVRYAVQYGLARGVLEVERVASNLEHRTGRTVKLVPQNLYFNNAVTSNE